MLSDIERFEKMFVDVFKSAQGEMAQKITTDTSEGGRKYDIKYPHFSQADFNKNIVLLSKMNIVKKLSGNEFSKTSEPLSKRVMDYFNSLNNNVYSDLFGDVGLTTSSMRDDIYGHGRTNKKIIAFAAIPEVIQNGVVIDSQKRNNNYDRIVVAAPISIGNEKYLMGVMLQRDHQSQRLYLHDVVAINKKETTKSSSTTPFTSEVDKNNESLYITNILEKALNVKSNLKTSQFDIIQATNPMWDEYHLGIRKAEDIRTWDEVLELDDEREGQFVWGDFSRADAEQAQKDGTITVYSSYPIENGAFVSTSYIQAEEYAGGRNSKVYSKTVPLTDVAWINGDEGQYANVGEQTANEGDISYSLDTPDPMQIANMTESDADTTPPLQRKTGTATGDGESKLYQSVQDSTYLNKETKAEAFNNDFIKKYQTITNKETLKSAYDALESGGRDYVNKWFAKDITKMTTEDAAVGFILLDRYQSKGDTDSVIAVIEKLREVGTKSGQTVDTPTPMQIANMTETDADTTPPFQRKTCGIRKNHKQKSGRLLPLFLFLFF